MRIMLGRDGARFVFAVMLLLGSATNLALLTTRPSLYDGFSDLAIWPVYSLLWEGIVLPNLTLMIGLVVAFEFAAAAMILQSGQPARVGLALTAAFMLLLVPFWWSGGAVLNLIFAVVLARMAALDYPHSMAQILGAKSTHGHA